MMHSTGTADPPSPGAEESAGEVRGRRSCSRGTRTAGFTLIEILVALAVLAIALGAVIAAAGRYADNAAYLREKTLATWVARNRLAQFMLAPSWPDTGHSGGDARMGEKRWWWRAEVSQTPDPMLRRIDVEVRSSKDGSPVTSLSGFAGPHPTPDN